MDESTFSTVLPAEPGHPAPGRYLTKGSRFSPWCAPNRARGFRRVGPRGCNASGLCSHLREDVGKVFTISAVSRSLVLEGCHEFEFLQACAVEVVEDEIEMRVV